ncbi:hypothetical protein SH467x_003911 [Pirellulaceae bacterium SH467]
MAHKATESSDSPKLHVSHRSCDSERRFRNALWWVMALLVICFLGYFYAVERFDEKLTGEILKRLQTEFPKHVVQLDRATLQPGKSIRLEGLRILRPTSHGTREVLRCGRLICIGPIDWVSLAQGQLAVNHVIADGVEIGIWPISSTLWSIQELSSSKPIPENMPLVELRSGLVRIGGETGKGEREIVCHDLKAKLELLPRVLDGKVQPIVLGVEASVASSYFQSLGIRARVNQAKTEWVSDGRLEKLEFSPSLASQLPSCLHQVVQPVDGLTVEMSLQFAANKSAAGLSYQVRGGVTNGRWRHSSIPFPLDEIEGDFSCDNGNLQARNWKARSSNAVIRADADWNGLTQSSPGIALIDVEDLDLDQRLYQSLPAGMQEIWRRVRPSGVIDAHAEIGFDGGRWTPVVQVQAKNGAVNADYFPYPISGIYGEFVYRDDVLSAPNLVGVAGERKVSAALELIKAQPRWLMDFKVAADGPIAIDENLIRALTPRGIEPGPFQTFVDSLHPQGTVHLKYGRFQRTADNPDVISKSIELTFSECSIKYDRFKYPIVDVHGEATIDNQRLILRDFVGRNDGARIKAFGLCQGNESGIEVLDLEFNAYDVQLDEELHTALPGSVKSLWDQLQPTGSMDHVQVLMRKDLGTEPLDIRVEMNEVRDSSESVGRTVSFRPTSMPYSIHDVSCCIKYRPGQVDVVSLSGVHDASRLQAEGHCRLHKDGTWDGTVSWLPSTRFIVDQNLLKCLPVYLRDPLMRVDFRGPVSIMGSTQISSPRSQEESIVRAWDLSLQVEDGRLGGGGIASGIRGAIALHGLNTDSGPMAFGKLDLDALAIKGVAVTGVIGPFALTQTDLMFGRDAISWQKQVQLPSTIETIASPQQEQVASAVFLEQETQSNVQQASFRSRVQNRIQARLASLSAQPLDPVPSTPPAPPVRDLPPLDLSEFDVRARTLSGTMFISGIEPLDGKRARYRLRLVDSHLKDCLLDLGESNVQTNGRLWVQCDVQGSITNLSSIEGTGNAWLREASFYELPAMIKLFQVLAVRPEQGAFDAADIRFSIDGERFPIQELQLDGNLVSVRGSGWVNLRRELHLNLTANASRRTLVGAMMRPLAPSDSANLLRIEVTGTASAPNITRSGPLMNSW